MNHGKRRTSQRCDIESAPENDWVPHIAAGVSASSRATDSHRLPSHARLSAAIWSIILLVAACSPETGASKTLVEEPKTNLDSVAQAPARVPAAASESFGGAETIRVDGIDGTAVFNPLLNAGTGALLTLPSKRTIAAEPHPSADDLVILSLAPSSPDSEVGDTKATSALVRVTTSRQHLEDFVALLRQAISSTPQALVEGAVAPPMATVSYQAVSTNGGTLSFEMRPGADGAPVLDIEWSTARSGTQPGRTNKAANSGIAYETLGVVAESPVEADRLEYLSGRAMQLGKFPLPPIADFEIPYHPWLRVTAAVDTNDGSIRTSVEALTAEATRVDLGRATVTSATAADYVTMAVSALEDPESPQDWTSPLTAVGTEQNNGASSATIRLDVGRGAAGPYARLAASSVFDLTVDVEYTVRPGTAAPERAPEVEQLCGALGSIDSGGGSFLATFVIADGLQRRLGDQPLVGAVYGVQYEAADVAAGAPRPGSKPIGAFSTAGVEFVGQKSEPFDVGILGAAGVYQFFGFLDVNGDANPTAPQPSSGDLLLVPTAAYELRCDEQPIYLEFGVRQP